MYHLQIGAAGSESGNYWKNQNAVTIQPDANGVFEVQVWTDVAGTMGLVSIKGRVTVLTRTSYGEPEHIRIEVNNLPMNIDISISFVPAPPPNLPKTGDPLGEVLEHMLTLALLLSCTLVVTRKRRV